MGPRHEPRQEGGVFLYLQTKLLDEHIQSKVRVGHGALLRQPTRRYTPLCAHCTVPTSRRQYPEPRRLACSSTGAGKYLVRCLVP
jgi:hypothetical protein